MSSPRRAPAGVRARLRLMATSDLHMHLTSYDYYADRPDPGVGLTRTASLIGAARAEAGRTGTLALLFDNGDAFQGAPMGNPNTAPADASTERIHPLMRAFAHLRYDAIGLGNHDFDFGMRALDRALRQAPCPVLSSNLRRLGRSPPPGFAPFAILDRMVRAEGTDWPIRIGVMSFLPPQTAQWSTHHLRGLAEIDDILDSARHWLPELRRAGCDLVAALAHSGLGPATARPGMENAAIPLAGIEGIDAIVAGHTHLHLPGTDHVGFDRVDPCTGAIGGTPAVMPGSAGSHLGLIDITLRAGREGRWHPEHARASLRPIADTKGDGSPVALVAEDAGLAAVLDPDHAETRARMRAPAGHSDVALHSYFTFFAPDRALALVAAAQAAALRPLLDGTGAADLPLLSAAAPGRFGARAGPRAYTDIPAGPLSERHVADLCVFPNELRCVIVTGSQLLDWLEMSASLFHPIPQGSQNRLLVDRAIPGHDFDVVHGLSYRIDLSRPARFFPDGTLRAPEIHRVRELRHQDTPVTPDQRFAVALNSYRASGGGRVAALADARAVPLPPMMIHTALRDYLAGRLPTDPLAGAASPWRFSPLPGTRVTALTGPGAIAYLDELGGTGIAPAGLDEHGFLRLSVPL